MQKVVITDYAFEDIDLEREVLAPLGCELAALKAGKDQALVDLVKDADAVITQFAPVNAETIAAMQKARVIVRYGIGVPRRRRVSRSATSRTTALTKWRTIRWL